MIVWALVMAAAPAQALEIYRNGVRYDIAARLPSGASFRVDGVDRKFELGGVDGNLRLIQDDYAECGRLIDERQTNWAKYGFLESFDHYKSANECSITIHDPAGKETVASFYIRIDACNCFSALHFRFLDRDLKDFEDNAPFVVASVRVNNSGAAGPDVATRGSAARTDTNQAAGTDDNPTGDGPSAPAMPATARVSAALEGLTCLRSVHLFGENSSQAFSEGDKAARALILMSAWTGTKIADMARRAGVSQMASSVNYDFPGEDRTNLRQIETVIAAHGEAIARMEADVARYGLSLCGIVSASLHDTVERLYNSQGQFRSVSHWYLEAAQQLTQLHECASGEIDGAFGPSSRTAWNRMLAALGQPSVGGDFTPTMSDVIRVAAIPVTGPACDGASAATAGTVAIPVLPFLYGRTWTSQGWLERRTPKLRAILDNLATANEWTPFQQRLVRVLVNDANKTNDAFTDWDFYDAMALERIFKSGIGVAPNEGAASYWRSVADRKQTEYQRYVRVIETGENVRDFTLEMIRANTPPKDTYMATWVSSLIPLDARLAMNIDRRVGLARLSHLVMKYPEALATVEQTAGPELLYPLADRLLEGSSVLGKGTAQARVLLEAAVKQKAPYAASRLAFMLYHGNGGPADKERAKSLFQFASRNGGAFADYALGRIAEIETPEDPDKAFDWYERFLTQKRNGYDSFAAGSLIINRMMAGSLALATPRAKALVEKIARGQQDYGQYFPRSLALLYLCSDCGGSIDYAEAARWLRITRDGGAGRAGVILYRLLKQFPELATSPNEAIDSLKFTVDVANEHILKSDDHVEPYLALKLEEARNASDPAGRLQHMKSVMDGLCRFARGPGSKCETAAKHLASGAFGADLVVVGLDRLEELNSVALVDVLAAYGDFKGALERGLRAEADKTLRSSSVISSETSERDTFFADIDHLRAPTLRRLVSQRDPSDMASLPDGFVEYLGLLARNGDDEAREYLQLVSSAPAPLETVSPDLEAARQTFERVKARGGLSMSLVNAARIYSTALQAAQAPAQALQYELTALAAERQLDQVTGFNAGPLQGRLKSVCHLSKASERIFALGADGVALVLAKDAINELQDIRQQLASLPERLQGCFRDLVADNYRWLADLLVRQDRLSEAELVLSLLKDFEAFQFAGRDSAFSGDAFRQLPYSAAEQALKDALDDLTLPTVTDTRRRIELRAKQSVQSLTRAEQSELATIEQNLAAAEATYEAGLQRILDAADGLDGAALPEATLAAEQSVQETLLGRLEENVAAIHYLVMPDRLNIILTTRKDRKSVTIDTWNDEPFSEARLNEELEYFHFVISNPSFDPLPVSRQLYDLLVAPLEEDLKAADPEMLLVSLDKRLRYLPYQTLHDGEKFLVERFALSLLTSSESEISGSRVSDVPFAALGMTQQSGLFAALPGVAVELDGIVKGQNGFGLFDGQVYMDEAFDRPALVRSLKIGETGDAGLGFVHVSSHFQLGDNDVDSFLLLGNGEHLSLAEIKDDPKAFDFSHVELLTLSACETGRAHPDNDGREIESLAKITGDRGAHSTIASLWPVADSSTALLMQRFYELRALGSMSKAKALAVAQREFIRGEVGSSENLTTRSIVYETARRFGAPYTERDDGIDPGFAHPFYWAPFVLTGNWR